VEAEVARTAKERRGIMYRKIFMALTSLAALAVAVGAGWKPWWD
jgi:hypothetical protein